MLCPDRPTSREADPPSDAEARIEAYLVPPGLGAADDLEALIVDFVAGARSKLDIAVQELDSEAIRVGSRVA